MIYLFNLILALCFAAENFELSAQSAVNKWSGQISVENPDTDNQFLKITTVGKGEPSLVSWTFKDPVDMEKNFVQAYVYISSFEAWESLELRLSSEESSDNYIAIPVPRFTDPNFNWIFAGEWLKITLTLGDSTIKGTPDMHAIKYLSWYVNDKGTAEKPSSPLSVSLSGVAVVKTNSEPLLSITFDDGHEKTSMAADIMAQYGLRGTAYIIPEYLGKTVDEIAYMSADQVLALNKKYRWGISAHHQTSFDMFSPGKLQAELDGILSYLTSQGFAFSAPHMAYPLGRTDSTILDLVSQHYRTGRIASGGAETMPPADWRRLRTINVTPDVTAEVIKEKIKKAQMHNEWIILMFHKLTEGPPPNELTYNIDEFKKVVEVISNSGITTMPVHEVWEANRVD